MASLSNQSGLGAGVSGAPAGSAAGSDLRSRLIQAHGTSKAMFDHTGDLVARADRARIALAALAAMGDQVTQEDVVKEAGGLVAKGEDPLVLAGLLSDMPEKGEALAAWVADHAQKAAQTEAQIAQAHEMAKHQLGVNALHVLQAHGGGASPGASPGPSTPGPSALPNPLLGG